MLRFFARWAINLPVLRTPLLSRRGRSWFCVFRPFSQVLKKPTPVSPFSGRSVLFDYPIIVSKSMATPLPKRDSLTLPPLKAPIVGAVGGFFLQPEPPATAKALAGLTLSPEAKGPMSVPTASPAAFTFTAALTSRSCTAPHRGHTHARTDNGSAAKR